MSAGLEVYNTNGFLQITDSFRNLQYLGKETISVGSANSPFICSAYSSVVPFTDTKMLAFRCTNGKRVQRVTISKNTTNNTDWVDVYAEAGAIVTVYKYGFPVTKTGAYFEVYNSAGSLVFSDNAKYMKVLGMYSGTTTIATDYTPIISDWNVAGNSQTIKTPRILKNVAVGSAITTAVIPSQSTYYWDRFPATVGQDTREYQQYWTFASTTVDTGIIYSNFNEYQGLGSGLIFKDRYDFLVIDVTGL
ncbi:hypothetical protein SOV_50770 [Sporomusa ovata DSM 2662]|uniref:Uncharacterized protein n=1 Tax=Sporomusa ovata TaxID=2378 RepID=A0A0U1L2Z7_9FIRM|nr:hypothetical protein [Sporomusa ovata]EQB27450.1 hypothetical protein SOV_2c03460 [Sporomusa ovata DSM 2662]CQR73294.1 hypothetical protein SpAn4DRAFT_2526 [Sporomusa ovata]